MDDPDPYQKEHPFGHIETPDAKIILMMRDPLRYMDVAHDVAAAEPDKEKRPTLYRHLYLSCMQHGLWQHGAVFQPFTGDEWHREHICAFFRNALANWRARDALLCADFGGLTVTREQLKRLAGATALVGDDVATSLLLQAHGGDDLSGPEWAAVGASVALGKCSAITRIAYGLATGTGRIKIAP